MALVQYSFTIEIDLADAASGGVYAISVDGPIAQDTNGTKILPLPPSCGRLVSISVNKEDTVSPLPGGGNYNFGIWACGKSPTTAVARARAVTMVLLQENVVPLQFSKSITGVDTIGNSITFFEPDFLLNNSANALVYTFSPAQALTSNGAVSSSGGSLSFAIGLDGVAEADHVFRVQVAIEALGSNPTSPTIANYSGDPPHF
jgi:hypothetical protein